MDMLRKTSMSYKLRYFAILLLVPQVVINKGFFNTNVLTAVVAMAVCIVAVYLLEQHYAKYAKNNQ